jgi:hypothetical protein
MYKQRKLQDVKEVSVHVLTEKSMLSGTLHSYFEGKNAKITHGSYVDTYTIQPCLCMQQE